MEEPKMKPSGPLPPCAVLKCEQIEINFLKICSTDCYFLVKHAGNFWAKQDEADFVPVRRHNLLCSLSIPVHSCWQCQCCRTLIIPLLFLMLMLQWATQQAGIPEEGGKISLWDRNRLARERWCPQAQGWFPCLHRRISFCSLLCYPWFPPFELFL